MNPGDKMFFSPTTNLFQVTVIRPLRDDEKDPEVGDMYMVEVTAYADELSVEKPE